MPKPCKDCLPDSTRPTPHPGPRCVTHHRAFKKAQKARNHDQYVQRTYGLAKGDYARLYLAQGGKCAICLKATGTGAKKLAVDHDHKTGEVRGLLNARCNHDLLGFFSREDLVRAIEYLDNPPARKVLGNGNS